MFKIFLPSVCFEGVLIYLHVLYASFTGGGGGAGGQERGLCTHY